MQREVSSYLDEVRTHLHLDPPTARRVINELYYSLRGESQRPGAAGPAGARGGPHGALVLRRGTEHRAAAGRGAQPGQLDRGADRLPAPPDRGRAVCHARLAPAAPPGDRFHRDRRHRAPGLAQRRVQLDVLLDRVRRSPAAGAELPLHGSRWRERSHFSSAATAPRRRCGTSASWPHCTHSQSGCSRPRP